MDNVPPCQQPSELEENVELLNHGKPFCHIAITTLQLWVE